MGKNVEIICENTKRFELASKLLKGLIESVYDSNVVNVNVFPLKTYEEISVITEDTRRIMIFSSPKMIPADGEYDILYKQFNVIICKDEDDVYSILVLDDPISKLEYQLLINELIFLLKSIDEHVFHDSIQKLKKLFNDENFADDKIGCYNNSSMLAVLYFFAFILDEFMLR